MYKYVKKSIRCGQTKKYVQERKSTYMVKNTECLNTTNCCVFKCRNVSNGTTVFNSQRCSKVMFKIVHFTKIPEDKRLFREYLE